MPKKVLHVSESNEWSGGAAQLLALADGLRRRGWDCRLAGRPGSGLEKHAGTAGLPFFGVALREDYDLVSAWQLASFINREGIDVVHAHHNRAHAVCLLAKALLKLRAQRTPALLVSRRVSFAPGKNPFSRWKYQSRLIDRIVAVAEAVKDVLVDSGVDGARVAVIRSGVDLQRFSPQPKDAQLRQALGLPPELTLIGKIANASPWKGQSVMLEAAAILLSEGKPFHFLFAGRDTQSDWMKADVDRLKIGRHVTLLGFRQDVPNILNCLDLSVNAAVRGEGLSGALRESLAAGVAVVASDIAGNRELLGKGGNDFLCAPGNARALAERIVWALENPNRRQEQVDMWRRSAKEEFSLEQTVEKTAALYENLLKEMGRDIGSRR